jgi:uncharacterized membrane protein
MINAESPLVTVDAIEVAQTTAQMRATHKQEASVLQHGLDDLTAIIGSPLFVALLSGVMFVWVAGNLLAEKLGLGWIDPPPFAGLEAFAAIGSLLIVALILTTQRREDQLADHRTQLILELSIANDQKIAKIIALLEESRRDNPAITNRVDDQAAAMATPSDTAAVLEAIKDSRDDVI